MRQRAVFTILVLGVILTITGCSAKINLSKLSENTVIVLESGRIAEVAVEEFSKEYYSLEELKNFVNQTAAEFNTEYPVSEGDAVTVDKLEELQDQKKVRVEMTYTDISAFEAFHGISFRAETIDTLDDEMKELKFVSRAKGEPADILTLKDAQNYQVLVTRSPLNIMVEGKVEYCSDNVEVIDKNHVKTAEGLSVIIYK